MDISDHISSLKKVLTSLPDSGPDGFEGLIRITLSEITGVHFRLAGSTLQFGVDGKSDEGIAFECKCYVGPVKPDAVMSKMGDLSARDDVDLWVLCATSPINSQLVDRVRKSGENLGISILIFDWSEDDLSPLAVALTMAHGKVEKFLSSRINKPASVEKCIAAFAAIENDSAFESREEGIRTQLQESILGMSTARKANTKWLTETFSNKQLARQRFGQSLAPRDGTNKAVLLRDNLVAELSLFLTGEPNGKILCVLGDEGNGKSWLVAQSWLLVEEKPLMVVLNPNAFADTAEENDVQELLISALIKQTGGQELSSTKKKWLRVFRQWQLPSVPEEVRLVVLIDGLNQRPEKDWALILEKFSAKLHQISGQLIVTARTPYYRSRVQRRLTVASKEWEIPEWTECERDRILAACGIVTANLQPNVAASLLNPRLLGIALDLLESADIACLEELNVSRLLFEHICASDRYAPVLQPVDEFVQELRTHAEKVIKRIDTNQERGLVVFDQNLKKLNAVTDGRFYHSLKGNRYTLKEDGLTLALGFAVIDRLQVALCENHDLNDALEKVIDPIAALDMTASVIFAALTVTCIDNEYPDDFATALIQTFANLQNPADETEFASFAHLARIRPAPFMKAARDLCLSSGYQINFDWIQSALIKARADSNAWNTIFEDVKTWLSYYTPLAEGDATQDISETLKKKKRKKEKKRQKSLGSKVRENLQAWGEKWEGELKKEKQQRTQKNIEALSEAEKKILSKLTEMDSELNTLSRFAFILLAGRPIEPAAQALVQWSFANTLNTDLMPPNHEFRHLVRFNQVDWSDARSALLKEVEVLRQNEISDTGKWALVNVLRATGNPEDAKYAKILVDELTKDRPHFPGWRRVENYCATDPCDPKSEKPDNVKQTAQNYKDIDVSQIWVSRSQTSAGLFLTKARSGMARFESQVAIAKQREFTRDVMQRKGSLLLLGLLGLREHNALLSRGQGLAFANLQESEYTDERGLSERDRWLISEDRLFLAFPFLSSSEQIDSLLFATQEGGIFYRLMDKLMGVAKPIEETVFDNLLELACQKEDEHAQYVLLRFAKETATPISTKSREHIACLLKAQSKRVREQVLGIIFQLDDVNLLANVVHSGWQTSESDQTDEGVYGSAILTQAAAYGIIEYSHALDCMSFNYYGRAAQVWSSTEPQDAVREVALRVDAAICSVANIDTGLTAPDIEMQVGFEDGPEEFISFPDEPADLAEQLMRLTESAEAVEERQKRKYDAYLAFRDELTSQKCDMILGKFDLDEFRTIVEANEDLADRWYEMLISVPKSRLPAVHNLVLHLAYALGNSNPGKAAKLFHKVRDSNPLVRITYYPTAVSLDAMSIWSGPNAEILNKLRFQRLDRTTNDHELSQEVLAAHLNDKQDLLRQYIEAKLKKEEPAEIARAIMVAGFSDHCEFNVDVLNRYQDTDGFIGDAHNAAQYAYERNSWARYWFAKMCEVDEADEFWCFSILFTKIVDRRYYIWQSEYTEENEPMQLFWPSVRSKLKNRFDRWENLRKEKLFGGDVPNEIFLFPEE